MFAWVWFERELILDTLKIQFPSMRRVRCMLYLIPLWYWIVGPLGVLFFPLHTGFNTRVSFTLWHSSVYLFCNVPISKIFFYVSLFLQHFLNGSSSFNSIYYGLSFSKKTKTKIFRSYFRTWTNLCSVTFSFERVLTSVSSWQGFFLIYWYWRKGLFGSTFPDFTILILVDPMLLVPRGYTRLYLIKNFFFSCS